METGSVVLKRFYNTLSIFRFYLPFIQDHFVPSIVEIERVILKKEIFRNLMYFHYLVIISF